MANPTVFGKTMADGEFQLLAEEHKWELDDLLKNEVTTSSLASMKLPEHKIDYEEENEVNDPVAEENVDDN